MNLPLPIAHGLVQRADLPIPEWLFGWAAAVVLVVSFVALAVLWSEPRLEGRHPAGERGSRLGRALASGPVVAVCRTVGVVLLALTLWAGFAGSETATANFAPTFVFITFWVGTAVASLVVGDVFRAFNPWLTLGLLVDRARRGAPARYPESWGRWPAAAGIVAFTMLELDVLTDGTVPSTLASAALTYTLIQLYGCWRYGARAWCDHAEAFGVTFGLIGRIGVFEVRDEAVRTRPPLAALTKLEPVPGTVPLIVAMIGTVSFDGLSSGSLWADTLQPALFDAGDVVLGARGAESFAALVGLAACIAAVGLFYRLGIAGARTVGGGFSEPRLRATFVHSLVPIAVVYVLAHYLSYLVFEGQQIIYLVSDPLGEGWDLLGTASYALDFKVLSQNAVWYLQVGVVVLGHVAALTLAHDRALVLYPGTRMAVRSQYWMLAIMVGFTTLALWLLASAGT